MGCIRSKPIYDQAEKEDGYVLEGPDESHSTELKLGFVIEKQSFESSSDVGFLPENLEIGDDSTVAANELGTGEPTGRDVPSDNTEDKSPDDGEDVMTVRMQLLREIAKLQMAELSLARNRLHWCIIQRDAMIVVEALKKSQPFYEDGSGNIPTDGGGEMFLTDDAIESTQTHSQPANEIAIWVLDVVLDDINYDGLNDAGKDEELDSDDEDIELSDLEYFQFQRTDRFRMTVRRPSRLPPSPLNGCTEGIDLKKEASTEQNKLTPSTEIDISGASTSTRDIDSDNEKSISKDIELFAENTTDFNDSTTDVVLPVPEGTVQSTSDNDLDQTIENGRALLNDHNTNLSAPDQVPSNDITTESLPPNDEETSIDEDREKRRLQWLARRKATIRSVHVQLPSDTQPREIDIDSVMARKKFPWMR